MKLKKIKDSNRIDVTIQMSKKQYDFIKNVKIFSMDTSNDRVIVETLNEKTCYDMHDFLSKFFNAIRKGE